jgi:integrase
MECVRLRVKDIDFALAQITVRDAKGGKDRLTMLPLNLSEPLRRHLLRTKAQHEQDLEDGFGTVHLPFALSRKSPNAAREWAWQYVFPSSRISVDPRSGKKTATSRGRRNFAKCDQKSSGRVQDREACELPQSAALLCNVSTD